MSVSLQKGQKVSLSKGNEGLSTVLVGLGWDEKKEERKFRWFKAKWDIDCDASAILLINGKLINMDDVVFYRNLRHKSGAVQHMGDNLTGAGEGDDEQIIIDLEHMPAEYDKIVIVVSIYDAVRREQHFGMIQNAFVRLVDSRTNKEMCKFDLTENYSGMTAIVFGEIYRNNGEWNFSAIGQGTRDTSIDELCSRYK